MRSEQEMLDLILETARQDERIRAVVMNGSRANPNAPRDFFQDFDIVYIVTGAASFRADDHWIDRFGEMMILQMPDDMGDLPPGPDDSYGYLMQFMDGNRIDLTISPLDKLEKQSGKYQLRPDSQTILLLDKDGCIAPPAPASDLDYLPKLPTARAFFNCCNEFWWVNAYAAKGLWRSEITFAKYVLDHYIREQLMLMLDWYVGMQTGFAVCTGKQGKYLERYLEPELWQMLLKTYADADYENNWNALEMMGALFRKTAVPVAQHFGFDYLHGEDARVSAHVQHVRRLPKDAETMY